LNENYAWINEPPSWSGGESDLSLTTANATDFWRKTFYGFTRDNGHAYLRPVSGDFSASATVVGAYEELYDQAGLMVRVDERNWIKTGIEYTDRLMHFSVVVTREVSDWSVIPLPDAKPESEVRVRLTRHDNAVRIQYAVDGSHWRMARLAPFFAGDAHVGVMACSPERAGFQARFRDIEIGPAIDRKLHDD
jgi:regulation of enolase protein 1 (concanavalin A-like superfamily)